MNEPAITDIWVYLSASPLLGLTITLVAYGLAYRLYLKANSSPFANPVLMSVVMLISLLMITGTSYSEYFEGARFVHFLLGPATVALAVPLYEQLARLNEHEGVEELARSRTARLLKIGLPELMRMRKK